MDTSIIVVLISTTGVILAAIITAFGVSSRAIHKIELQLVEIQSTLKELSDSQNDNSELLKKINRNTKYVALNRGKITNVDKRLLKVEDDLTKLKTSSSDSTTTDTSNKITTKK